MKAMLLGAGEGTRLRPITATRPKPMIPVVNRPIMEHILLLLKAHGVREVYSNLYYLADQIESYFGDGSSLGMTVKFKVEERLPGTAGGVKNLEDHFDETFIVISGDLLTDFDLTRALEFHRNRGAIATILLTRIDNPLEYGVVITDRAGRVQRFLEKPDWSEVFSDTINTGIYILEPEVLEYIPAGQDFDFSRDLFPLLLKENKPLFGCVADGYWCDVGNIDTYLKAQVDAISGKVKVSIPGEQIAPGIWAGKSAKISSRADLKGPMVLGENCEVAPGARLREYCVVGDNVIVAPNSFLVRSTVFGNSYIGEGSVVSGSIICKNVVLKDSVRVGEGAVVSDDCILNTAVTVKPGVRVWPGKVIDESVVLSSSVVWGQRLRRELFHGGGISGLVNFEFTPEFAVRLGSAIGGTLRKGASVVVSRDPSRTARMMKRALVAGLSSSGVSVCDLQGVPLPILTHMAKRTEHSCAIHTQLSESNYEAVDIKVFDKDGLAISRDEERKIETLLSREDPRRTSAREVGGISYFERSVSLYTEDCLSRIDVEAAKSNRMKLVVDCGFGLGGSLLPSMLVKMGADVTAINAIEHETKMPKTAQQFKEALDELALIVKTIRADMGILIDPQGAKMWAIDDSGRVLTDLELAYLFSLLRVRASTGGSSGVTMPSYTPSVFIRTLTANGATVYRAKSHTRSLADLARTSASSVASDLAGGFVLPEIHNSFDAIFGAAKFVELVASDAAPLSQLAQLVPEHHFVRDAIPCPWEFKGQVMRELLGRLDDASVDTFDGYRKGSPDAWYMVLPDPSRPSFTIYAEGSTRAEALEMLQLAAKEVDVKAQN
ncbi:MAG: sugar phosphate nucleotidyltransferase [Clostridia bacterium]|nr:sugar phosphate nucleotidyltransferase [Clostridia bacterium]